MVSFAPEDSSRGVPARGARSRVRTAALLRSRGWRAREGSRRMRGREMLRLTLAWVLVNASLMAPAWLAATLAGGHELAEGTAGGFVALESLLIVGSIAVLPARAWSAALAWAAALGVVLATLVGLADLVFQVSLGRPLNLFIDLYLVGAVWDLAVGNLGRVPALAALLGLLLVLSLASFGLARLLAPVRPSRSGRG